MVSEQIVVSMVGVAGAVVGSLGALAAAVIQRDANRTERQIERLKQTVDRFRCEIVARQKEEEVAMKWLVELNGAASENAAKIALRDRTEETYGHRPRISPNVVAPP
jgi:hypothetical protein